MECSLFKRPRHQAIAKLLACFDARALAAADCYFGGGTAIVLKLGEYRKSVDVDFMCATANGYRLVRNIVSPQSLGDFTKAPLTYRREVSTSQYNVRTIAEIDGFPIKIEFVREARIELRGCFAGAFRRLVKSLAYITKFTFPNRRKRMEYENEQ